MAFIFPKTATARPEDALEVDTNLPDLATASRVKLYAKNSNHSAYGRRRAGTAARKNGSRFSRTTRAPGLTTSP